MRCPFCAADDDKVIETRVSKDGIEIRRRRECVGCGRRFTTYERIEESMPMVIKNDGRREPFDRNKIERGIHAAVAKRPVSEAQVRQVALEIEKEIGSSASRSSRPATSASACSAGCARSTRSRTCGSRRSTATSATSPGSPASSTPRATGCGRARPAPARASRSA